LRPPFVAWLALAALLLYAFGAAALRANGGELCPPLDDTFIHFQYAARLAEGDPYRYQAGAAASSGATSLLWSALLAVGVKLGFGGMGLFRWALGIEVVAVAATLWHTRRWLARVADPRTALAGTLALALTGPWLWGAFSGMEIALYSAAIAGVLDLGYDDRPTARRGGLAWACVLALVRPEGALLAAALFALRVVGARMRTRNAAEAAGAALPWALPVLLGAIQPALNLAYTGVLASSSALAKQNPRIPNPAETLLADFVWEAVGGGYVEHFGRTLGLPVLLLFVAGLAALLVRDRAAGRPGVGAAAALVWGLPIVFCGLFLPITWNHFRYLQPGLVVYVPLAAVGAGLADTAIARLRAPGVGATPFVLFGFVAAWATGAPRWAEEYGRNTTDILVQHVDQARWIARSVRPGEVVAANDVGALAWLGEHPVLDLEGIVSMDMLPDAMAGEGAVYARLRREGVGMLLVYPGWFPTAFQGGVFVPVRHARLARRTVAGGEDLVFATFDRERAASADREPDGSGAIVDTLDVGDRVDEGLHGWRMDDGPLFAARANTVQAGRYDGGALVIDNARRLARGAAFRMRAAPGVTRLVGRFAASEGPALLDVEVDGKPVATWLLRAVDSGGWGDFAVDLPGGVGELDVVIRPRELPVGPKGGWHLARLWTTEPAPDESSPPIGDG
jgi:hypothetical protein